MYDEILKIGLKQEAELDFWLDLDLDLTNLKMTGH